MGHIAFRVRDSQQGLSRLSVSVDGEGLWFSLSVSYHNFGTMSTAKGKVFSKDFWVVRPSARPPVPVRPSRPTSLFGGIGSTPGLHPGQTATPSNGRCPSLSTLPPNFQPSTLNQISTILPPNSHSPHPTPPLPSHPPPLPPKTPPLVHINLPTLNTLSFAF